MEKTKIILEKILKAMIVICSLFGITCSILFLRIHIKSWPLLTSIYSYEIILFVNLIITFLLAIKFKFKYFKWVAFIGIILAGVNLFGFGIFIKRI
ncbi:hypothetical protein [Anaerosalibacter sp. Marseille-P3206]|uniref:hypothetical protein n=1 Tax=Anaerosalibacter sp. Marseille-P3206 TaxID=1871005 RepID=UPI00098562CC|nr:hypothetical protein [Anaerosalibacter sp. Marseille-P3206]